MSATITNLHEASRSHGGAAMLRDVGLDRSGVEDAVRHGRPWAVRLGDPGGADAPRIVHPTSLTEWR